MSDTGEQKFIQVVKEICHLVKTNEENALKRDDQVRRELSELRKISGQMVQVLNDQGWIKKHLDKHEDWLIALSKQQNKLENSCKNSSSDKDGFHEWFIRLAISTVFSLLVGIAVFMVTKT